LFAMFFGFALALFNKERHWFAIIVVILGAFIGAVIVWAIGFTGDRQGEYGALAVRREIPRHPMGPFGGSVFLFLIAAGVGIFCSAVLDDRDDVAIKGMAAAINMELAISLTYVCGMIVGLIFILPVAYFCGVAVLRLQNKQV